jgi:hypothetical protein
MILIYLKIILRKFELISIIYKAYRAVLRSVKVKYTRSKWLIDCYSVSNKIKLYRSSIPSLWKTSMTKKCFLDRGSSKSQLVGSTYHTRIQIIHLRLNMRKKLFWLLISEVRKVIEHNFTLV